MEPAAEEVDEWRAMLRESRAAPFAGVPMFAEYDGRSAMGLEPAEVRLRSFTSSPSTHAGDATPPSTKSRADHASPPSASPSPTSTPKIGLSRPKNCVHHVVQRLSAPGIVDGRRSVRRLRRRGDSTQPKTFSHPPPGRALGWYYSIRSWLDYSVSSVRRREY